MSISEHLSTMEAKIARPQPMAGTMGMFIVDTFSYVDADSGEDLGDRGRGEQLGGGGLYFAIGARLWLQPPNILMVIDRGTDFKPEYQRALDHFASAANHPDSHPGMWRWRDRSDAKTTKAVNRYIGDRREFDYLSPKLRLDPPDLVLETHATLPQWIHCICSPERAKVIVEQIKHLDAERSQQGSSDSPARLRTRICWEPIPDSCVPENLAPCLDVMKDIDVISPNHEEAAALLRISLDHIETQDNSQTSRAALNKQRAAARAKHIDLLARGLQQHFYHKHAVSPSAPASSSPACPIIIIRGGAAGSSALCEARPMSDLDGAALTTSRKSATPAIVVDVPAYHGPDQADRVRDVTGGGNSFLGGLVAYLALDERLPRAQDREDWTKHWLREALIRGAVSASCVIEQAGLPALGHPSGPAGQELWNGQTKVDRLEHMRLRIEEEVNDCRT